MSTTSAGPTRQIAKLDLPGTSPSPPNTAHLPGKLLSWTYPAHHQVQWVYPANQQSTQHRAPTRQTPQVRYIPGPTRQSTKSPRPPRPTQTYPAKRTKTGVRHARPTRQSPRLPHTAHLPGKTDKHRRSTRQNTGPTRHTQPTSMSR